MCCQPKAIGDLRRKPTIFCDMNGLSQAGDPQACTIYIDGNNRLCGAVLAVTPPFFTALASVSRSQHPG
jgi:hypothetical protein